MKKYFLSLAAIFFIFNLSFAQIDELKNVNTDYIEFSPSISAEGNYMIFQSDKDASEFSEESIWKLYNTHLEEEGWSQPVEIKNINNNVAFVAGPSLSYDGNTLYLTAFIEGESESEDIFYSIRTGETWSEPINIGSSINTPDQYEGFPSISSDENSIYFVRVNEDNAWDRKSKENCFKIYVAHRASDSTWTNPEPLPAPVNLGCEHAPRILADNKTLVFSSIRKEGMGGFDLYQSTLIGDNEWSEPIALDFINTKESDLSPSIPASGDKVFYVFADDIASSIVPENFRQSVNITVHGILKDQYKDTGLDGFVNIVDPETDKIISKHNTNSETGNYSLVLQTGKNYKLVYGAKNYGSVEMDYDLMDVKEYQNRELNLELSQVYNASLLVKDAEVETEFEATVAIVEDTESVSFEELTLNSGVEKQVDFPSGLIYTLISSAKNYVTDTLLLDLKNTPQKGNAIVLNLEPKKVPVSISLGGLSDGKKRKVRVKNERTGETIEADDNQTLLLRSGERYKVIVNSEKGYAYTSTEIDLTDADEDYASSDETNEPETTEATGALLSSTGSSIPKQDPKQDTEGSSATSSEIKIDIPMVKLQTGTQIEMENVLFETNSVELDTSSFTELDQLVDMLNNNPELRIEIAAHTDDVGSESINQSLSQQRAQSVANYLEEKGIASNRYTVKGYGESEPRVPNDSAENRARNRRVEFIVIE